MKSIHSTPVYTWHALERMRTLLITDNEVNRALREPHITQPGGPEHGDGRVVYVGDRILVVAAEDTVITVKLRSHHPYVHGIHTMNNHPDAQHAA